MNPAAKRILVYFLAIVLVAAVATYYRGAERVSGGTIAAALLFALVCAALVWLRWDWAPRSFRQRRDGGQSQSSEPDAP